ncbi:Crp/Fnr family transcriptional regulator [Marinilongibacter aquaticus]|uniref:Crp/Fnr family transcriptional regulator n=1 Tax=Marinilongibacter aquaticus TaxID=2975157 RepID=UPI0021BDEA2E|nr:Crp/Fnr family transcriptional regulator [Marinilongibacter aquaticus]UBM59531.1 Crp/Fnr family transcriptional regulator [Marinilongibacter aquaticus]
MSDAFRSHLEKFIPLESKEYEQIRTFFRTETVRKKEDLLSEGQVCHSHYFVLKGILRKFFINEKGTEQTTEFAIENWWMTDTFSFLNDTASEFFIQAVEKCELLSIRAEAQEKLLQEHPVMEKYFRCIYQKAYAANQMRFKYLYGFSSEERYTHFLKKQPKFLQRVPQYLIASYLGFTPEYLSEIRKKHIS